ncbi:small ubiquitin-related modifier 2-A-like [Styela clava]|uniref:small ubiquitin-related modifier 2-A-like n=1 Tax=Styela clava TaxID=7725 RepID=UPI00193A169F|nr:small ubiquitin-related modifier 2-A-like [Styela clava]
MADAKPKDVKPDGDQHINLKVSGQDGSVIQFKIKRRTPMKKLITAYCDRQGVQIEAMRFRFDGTAISLEDTPEKLEMEDDDTIDVFTQQTGGNL